MKYNIFNIEGFKFDEKNLKARFFYNFDNELFFEEEIDYNSLNFYIRNDLNLEVINNILSHISIALGISYYKLFPTEKIIVKTIKLNNKSSSFWKKFYLNGLGEFFFKNNIDPSDLLNFEFIGKQKPKIEYNLSDKYLVPVGGGKDSIVSIELLNDVGEKFDLYTFGKDNKLYENTSKIAGKKRLITKRVLSPNLIDEINKGGYNGHVPITGIIAFNMILVSYLYDYKYLCLSNEKSANFGNIEKYGMIINHQWSKSLDFEIEFASYLEENISSEVKYFSLLRPFYEIYIAKLFSIYGKKYFTKFSSCNHNFKIFNTNTKKEKGGYWCNKCPKCAFVYSILSGFLEKEELLTIFSNDLFDDKTLEGLFRELLGIKNFKPLECVGEASEVVLSLKYSMKKYDKLPYILQIFKDEIDNKMKKEDYTNLEKKLFDFSLRESNIPSNLINKLANLEVLK